MNKSELLELISSFKIDSSEFTLLSTSALVMRDILDTANDLDIAVTDEGLKQLNDNYNLIPKENEVVDLFIYNMI